MYAEPQTISVKGVSNTLPRVAAGVNQGVFATPDGNIKLSVSHQNGKRNRRTVRLDFRKIAADPLLDGVSREYSMSAYVVVDHPTVGFNNTEVTDNLKALTDLLATAGFTTKLVGGES